MLAVDSYGCRHTFLSLVRLLFFLSLLFSLFLPHNPLSLPPALFSRMMGEKKKLIEECLQVSPHFRVWKELRPASCFHSFTSLILMFFVLVSLASLPILLLFFSFFFFADIFSFVKV
eukprot:TRINITY_DN8226_c5_g1_i1.p1 TRINITY_DN8226_c5_g1~~TRINITY_DN8226_c5_g1_i1.p1  ORF type:complete len:117 (+),score=0.50 TRINITY_DN8226_c5_g1_i1:271-621(+)